MPYVFQETQVGEPRFATEFPSLTSEVLEETFAQTFEENPIAATLRASELSQDYRSGRQLDAAAARQRLADRGMENDIKVSDAGISDAALDTLMFRKGIEKRRQEIFAQAEGGLAQGAARLGVGLATSLVDPVSVASAFIPVVGEARYLSMLGRAGGVLGRTAVRAGVGAAEGAAGAALLEPIIAGSRRYEQADYDMADSLLNVAFGSLFGAGLHSTFGAVSDGVTHYSGREPAWRGLEGLKPNEVQPVLNLRAEIERGMDARDIARATETWTEPMRKAVQSDLPPKSPAEIFHESLPPSTRELTLKQAIVQAIPGEPVNVQPIIGAAEARQTSTPEFKRWFGNSLVVDEAGQPLRLYRGEAAENAEPGGWYTSSAEAANAYAETWTPGMKTQKGQFDTGANVIPAYMSLRNPLVIAAAGKNYYEIPYKGKEHTTDSLAEAAKADGYDGVIVRDVYDGRRIDVYRAFRPEQVKSAIGNSGRFNPESASLTDDVDVVASSLKYAEKVLAREVDTGTPTADALKNAIEEASLAQTDLKALADRLGEEAEDAELRDVLQSAANADRWARAAELATVCLVRGG